MIAIFTNQESLAMALPKEDELSPFPSGVNIGNPLIDEDWSIAVSHAFSEDDLEFLLWIGAIVVDVLPDDWYYVEPVIIEEMEVFDEET